MKNIEIDLLERLLQTKDFNNLSPEEKKLVIKEMTEEEYDAMRELHINMKGSRPYEITPSPMLKTRLDKALINKKQSPAIFRLRMPVYQSAAAAVICLLIGMRLNFIQQKPTTHIAYRNVPVVKYVDRPVKEIQYVMLPAPKERENHPTAPPEIYQAGSEVNFAQTDATPETNPEFVRQQEIAANNIRQALNENNGFSVFGDTVLQKMMVTCAKNSYSEKTWNSNSDTDSISHEKRRS